MEDLRLDRVDIPKGTDKFFKLVGDVASDVSDLCSLDDPDLLFGFPGTDGRPILLATHQGAKMFDMGRFLAGDPDQGYIGTIGVPPDPANRSTGYHDLYAGFDPATQQDKFYGGGGGGYYVWDISRPEEPNLLLTITHVPGFNWDTPSRPHRTAATRWARRSGSTNRCASSI